MVKHRHTHGGSNYRNYNYPENNLKTEEQTIYTWRGRENHMEKSKRARAMIGGNSSPPLSRKERNGGERR